MGRRLYESEYAEWAGQELTSRMFFERRIRSWRPDQLPERALGFDFAYYPLRKKIWRLLGLQPAFLRPRGAKLEPPMWVGSPVAPPSMDIMPDETFSLLLQYKRSEVKSKVRMPPFARDEDYFRFAVNDQPDQHQVLLALENNLNPHEAVVRYAAPAFTSFDDLQQHAAAGEVLDHSGFIEPSALMGHSYWAFKGPGIVGQPNPDGEPALFESWEGLGDLVDDRMRESRISWDDHLSSIAEIAREAVSPHDIDEIETVLGRLESAELDLRPETFQRLRAAFVVLVAALNAGADWRILDRSSHR